MSNKLKQLWNSPYLAPLTEPLRKIGLFATVPLRDFGACLREALGSTEDKPLMARLFKELNGSGNHYTEGYTAIMLWVGMIAGGAGAAAGGFFGATALGGGYVAGAITGLALTGTGVMLGPFLAAGIVAAAGAVVGLALCPVPGFLEGCYKLSRHRKLGAAQATVTQAAPQLKQEDETVQRKAAELFEKVQSLPAATQGAVLKAMNDKFAATGQVDADKLLNAISALPAADQQTLVKTLRQTTLAEAFDAVAKQEAGDSVVLQKTVTTGGTLKLKKQPEAGA
ncbi:MAG: hypothetical protein ACAH80_17775 [Alphaproteobacteria bacterium]